MQLSANSGRATVSTRSGLIKGTARMKNVPLSDTSASNSHAAALSSVTSQHHSQRSSLESLNSSLPHKKTICSGISSRAGNNPVSTDVHHLPQQLQQRMIKNASTDHLASSANSISSSLSNNTFCQLFDVCPPLCADRLKPIRYETRSTIVRNCAKSNYLLIIVFNCQAEINDKFEVCLGFHKSSKNKPVVIEMMKISPNGFEVPTVYVCTYCIVLMLRSVFYTHYQRKLNILSIVPITTKIFPASTGRSTTMLGSLYNQ